MIINPNIPRGLSIHDSQEPSYVRPDFAQMIPFKPKAKYIPGEHPVKGESVRGVRGGKSTLGFDP